MRRPVGLTLVGLGSFLLALAPMVRFYVAENVVVVPLNYYRRTNLEAPNASYFDAAAQKQREGVTLAVTSTVRGDPRASNDADKIAVWDSMTEIYDKDRKKQVEFGTYRMSFNRRTGELVNCCGSHVDGDTKIRMSGYGLVLPLGKVQRRDYPIYDVTTRRSLPARFDGEERIHGLLTYRFVQTVPKYKVAALDYKLPGSLLNYGKKTELFQVDRFFEATNTIWFEPRTGIPVKHQENIKSTVETAGGKGSLTVAQATLITVDADQKSLADYAGDTARDINLVRTIVPWSSLAAGLLLLLAGAFLTLRTPPTRTPAPANPTDQSLVKPSHSG